MILAGSAMMMSADVVAKSHAEVGNQVAAALTEMMTGMSKITDKESAEAFAATIPATREKMKALLDAAQALPAPTDEEKTQVNDAVEKAEEKAGPAMMAMMASLPQNPDAEAIGVIIGQVMQDKDMEETVGALEKMYRQEDDETSEKAVPEEVAPKVE